MKQVGKLSVLRSTKAASNFQANAEKVTEVIRGNFERLIGDKLAEMRQDFEQLKQEIEARAEKDIKRKVSQKLGEMAAGSSPTRTRKTDPSQRREEQRHLGELQQEQKAMAESAQKRLVAVQIQIKN